ncbi:glycosyltransferase family 2 protein, partial [Muricomes intestini]|uniref:glycosyltransferase family 2 protein n=1 Tax=Muricomes intestini TaxID=1796634 RepID=UPI002FE3C72B
MSKIRKGMKIFIHQGPAGVVHKLKNHHESKVKEEKYKARAKGFHLISDEERIRQKKVHFQDKIKFSVITPLYNTPEEYLLELLHSLVKQTYVNWELCLADGSDLQHGYVGEICREWAKKDSRIIYKRLQENRGISENTNVCIELASGEYLGLLDHDDILHESALFEMLTAIQKTGADFLYSDEVKFSGSIEAAADFNFKPGFGKDELRSHNYICHFTVFKRELLEGEETFYRPAFDGSQDHDMVLRLTEKAKCIRHVPKVLYYWRVHPNSVSMNLDSKRYAVDAAIRAVSEQLVRSGEKGKVKSNLPYQTIYRIQYDFDSKNKVAVLVHDIESEEEYSETVKVLKEHISYKNTFIIPVWKDTYETDGQALNRVIAKTKCNFFVLLDSHCVPKNKGWIEEMLMFAQRRDVFAVGAKVLYKDNTVCCAGIALSEPEPLKIRFLCEHGNNEE